MAEIIIDKEKCIGCGACTEACPNEVYALVNGTVFKAHPDRCNPMDCVRCIYACAEKAIIFKY
jgi:NAD-dependent dihydropyrimidine dehydrogenase PreA subunit